MQVLIINQAKQNDSWIFEMSCGKQSATIWVSPHHCMVCCANASHRVWRGMGRRFDNIQQAAQGYKSSAMRSMIEAAAAAM